MPQFVFGQIVGLNASLDKKFDKEVKQLSQFMQRFNFDEKVQTDLGVIPNRVTNIMSLIDSKNESLKMSENTVDFLKQIGNDTSKYKIQPTDSNWYAIVETTFLYDTKPTQITFILITECQKNGGYKWVIKDVYSPLFVSTKMDKSFINPINNEIGFTELASSFLQMRDVTQYTERTFSFQSLSAFISYYKNGDIRFKQIDKIKYQFNQIPNWIFTVSYFNRPDFSSGWLISSITPSKN